MTKPLASTPSSSSNTLAQTYELMGLGLRTRAGQTVGLQRVTLQAKLQGVLLETTVRQHYRNDGPNNIEVSYVFPLAHEAMLAGMSVELNGKRLDGEIKPKRQAEATYEQAIDEGDTPVMLSEKSHGLYSADLGNLQPGDQAVIELRLLQTVAVDNGRVRLVFPTVIAPRYGDEHIQGGLEPHETTRADVMAEYGFFAQLTVVGQSEQNGLQVVCPSHTVATLPIRGASVAEHGVQITLSDKAWLDRDWVVLVSGYPQSNGVQTLHSHGYIVSMATFVPQFLPQGAQGALAAGQPLQMKLLVDCSGSMAGVAMAQAKRALHDIGSHLTEGDRVSLTVFGSSHRHLVNKLMPVSPSFVRRTYAPCVDGIDADMGGTEMVMALEETVAIKGAIASQRQDVLLITDGEIWDVDEMLANAREQGHRVFCVGVGTSPAGSLLTQLAEQTGGACVFVTPNESMSEPIQRLMQRMRLGQAAELFVWWSHHMDWISALPRLLIPGESVVAWGVCRVDALDEPVRDQLEANLSWHVYGGQEAVHGSIRAEAIGATQAIHPNLARLGFAQRIKHTDDEELATQWAIEQQLLSKGTKMILVHEREEGQKATTLPRLHQVEQMHVVDNYVSAVPTVWRTRTRTSASASMKFGKNMDTSVARLMRSPRDNQVVTLDESFEIPAFLRKQGDDASASPTPSTAPSLSAVPSPQKRSVSDLKTERERLLQELEALATSESDVRAVWIRFGGNTQHKASIVELVQQIKQLGVSEDAAWALLLQWLNNFAPGTQEVLTRYGRRVLREAKSEVTEDTTFSAYRLCASAWA